MWRLTNWTVTVTWLNVWFYSVGCRICTVTFNANNIIKNIIIKYKNTTAAYLWRIKLFGFLRQRFLKIKSDWLHFLFLEDYWCKCPMTAALLRQHCYHLKKGNSISGRKAASPRQPSAVSPPSTSCLHSWMSLCRGRCWEFCASWSLKLLYKKWHQDFFFF